MMVLITMSFRAETKVETFSMTIMIGEAFGVSYTAVSHIVKKVKTQMKANRVYKKNYELFNSQIKM